jgi:hypothetical protein
MNYRINKKPIAQQPFGNRANYEVSSYLFFIRRFILAEKSRILTLPHRQAAGTLCVMPRDRTENKTNPKKTQKN